MNISINNEILKTKINEDGIFRLTLSNQHNHNALSEEMMFNIQVALDESINNKKIRVVIISADGPTFSAGHDLKEMIATRKESYFKTLFRKCSRMMMTINQTCR